MAIQSPSNHFDIVRRITCRVETPHTSGTGIILPASNEGDAYLITAKHCLFGKDFDREIQSDEITLHIPSVNEKDFSTFTLDQNSRILLSSDTNLDIAIVKLDGYNLEIADISLLDVRYFQRECFFRGYPRADHLQLGINIHVNFVDNNIVSTQTPLDTYDSISHDNCDGFSGSGVFSNIGGTPFFVGLLYELKEPFRRFHVYNLSQINSVLSDNELSALPTSILPINPDIQKNMRLLERKSKVVLESIKDTFDDQFNLPRESVIPQFNEVFQAHHLVILKGVEGAGKSAFAKSQLSVLQRQGFKILALKADWFAKESVEEIFPAINQDLQDLLVSLGTTQQLIVLIDSLEKLLEVDTYFALEEFLQICKELPYVRLVITCRSYAYQHLIFDLHHHFPTYSFVDIPLLSDAELETVSGHFPSLVSLLENAQSRTILKRPFYLNLALRHKAIFQHNAATTELKFRELIWEHIVGSHSSTRANTFEQIVIERASQMSLFARLDGLHTKSLQELVRDGILEVDEITKDSYRPSHDIYEDIALIRYVTRAFQSKQNTEDFFVRIDGKTPAKRRGFRLWLNEALIEPKQIAGFIHDVFELQTISRFWLDELIVAILRSEYCQIFFEHNERLLLENNQALLLRFIHLLRTTCQEPDEKLIQALQDQDGQSLYQWIYLKPVGMGWEVIVRFIEKHFNDLSQHKPLILRLLIQDWSKKLQFGLELPVESRQTGAILLSILEEVKTCYKAGKDAPYSTKLINEGIELLFQLPKCFEIEVQSLIEEANIFTKKAKERYRSRERRLTFSLDFIAEDDEDDETRNYHLSDFYQTIIKFVLSGLSNQVVCLSIPELVCRVAKDQWLTYEVESEIDHYSITDRGLGFGLSISNLDYFPSGIYKTPIRFLLYSHITHALRLIVDVFNHSTQAYTNSRRGRTSNVVEVEIVHNDGTRTVQKGNAALWEIFRGNVEATEYLLESILMSLESWLFELCESNRSLANEWINISYSYLLKNSTSVAVTAVLASVAQAYPHRVSSLCFPILRVREFFKWDIHRLVGDQVPLAILDTNIPFAQVERHKSNQLPHRKNHLEFLVTKLQMEGFSREMNEIIDEHLTKCEPDDTEWKLALNRMDARKFIIDETMESPAENQIVLRPVIDEELQVFVEENAKEMETRNRVLGITNWAIALYNDKAGTDTSFAKWHQEFSTYQEIKESETDSVRLFLDPTSLAATGIKHFRNQVSPEQLKWCIEMLIEAVMERVSGNIHHAPYSSMYLKFAVETIPETLSLDIDDELKLSVKQVIFVALLYLVTNESEYPFEAFRNTVWKIDSDYADACVAGMIQYARMFKQRKWFTPNSSKAEEERKTFLERVQVLAKQVAANEISIDLVNLSFDTCASYFLSFAIEIVPFNLNNTSYHNLLHQLFHLHIAWNNISRRERHQEELSFEAQRELQRYIAKFLLFQDKDIGKTFFANILDSIFDDRENVSHESIKYVAEILEWMIVGQDLLQSESFWDIWVILEDRIRKSDRKHYVSYLFLSHRYWNSKADSWKPLQNKSLIVRRLVVEFGQYDLKAVLKLLSGIGTKELMPNGLNWLQSVLANVEDAKQELVDSNVFFYAEKLVQRTYYRYLREIKRDHQLQQSLLVLLDLMVDSGSSLAFIVRERLITA